MGHGKLSDDELYNLFGQGDDEAFDMLYQRYWKRLLYKALLKLQVEADAEEVVQDTLLDIWKSRGRLPIRNSFAAYIGAILRYKIMGRLAAGKKQACQPVGDLSTVETPDHSTQQWLDFAELQTEIETAISELPEKCQLVFRMSREDGLNDRQIAADLHVSQKTVEAHITKALKLLRVKLGRLSFMIILFR